jgi:hypothetical protein
LIDIVAGGGPEPPPLDAISSKLEEIMGHDHPMFEGIAGAPQLDGLPGNKEPMGAITL